MLLSTVWDVVQTLSGRNQKIAYHKIISFLDTFWLQKVSNKNSSDKQKRLLN
jgi:hypothetical protein